jgi:hypothetical protein
LTKTTELEVVVTKVEADLKINTAEGSPRASRVKVPVISIVGLLYAPGVIVLPAPSSTPVVIPPRLSANALAADVNADIEAPPSTAAPEKLMTPVGAVPPPTPTFAPAAPVIPLEVALVIVVFAKTPYVKAEPIERGDSAADATDGNKLIAVVRMNPMDRDVLIDEFKGVKHFIMLTSLLRMNHGAQECINFSNPNELFW